MPYPSLLLLLALLLALWPTLLWRPRSLPGVTRPAPRLVGHRGVRGPRPENTLPAFELAFDSGLDGIETDVQRTADGHLVLYHDFDVHGQPLPTLRLRDLRALEPGVPLLADFLDLARRHPGTLLNLELKAEGLRTAGLERDVALLVRRSGLADRILVSSFHPLALLRFRFHAPEVRTALLYAPDSPPLLRSPWLARWLHADALHPHESRVTPELLAWAHRRGLQVNAWTVNDPKRITSLRGLGADAIMGDVPEVLLRAASRPPITD